MFKRESSWHTHVVRQTKKGYLVCYDSRVQGEICNLKALVYFCERYPADIDLYARRVCDRAMTVADELLDEARFPEMARARVRVLRRPHRVR